MRLATSTEVLRRHHQVVGARYRVVVRQVGNGDGLPDC
jgi:hypothetical protein